MSGPARLLTGGELALARSAFADRLPLDRISFVDGDGGNLVARTAFRNGNGAITLGRRIYFRPSYFMRDFSAAKPVAQGLFVHELVHVWQYERLGIPSFLARYGRDYAACGFKAWRMYEYEPGVTRFEQARLEAQAEMTGDYAQAQAERDTARLALLAVNLRGSGFFGL